MYSNPNLQCQHVTRGLRRCSRAYNRICGHAEGIQRYIKDDRIFDLEDRVSGVRCGPVSHYHHQTSDNTAFSFLFFVAYPKRSVLNHCPCAETKRRLFYYEDFRFLRANNRPRSYAVAINSWDHSPRRLLGSSMYLHTFMCMCVLPSLLVDPFGPLLLSVMIHFIYVRRQRMYFKH